MLRSEDGKTEWYDQENYQEAMRNLKNKRKNFWMRESLSITQNWITKLNESTMYIAVFISPTRSESTQRERKTASNYP